MATAICTLCHSAPQPHNNTALRKPREPRTSFQGPGSPLPVVLPPAPRVWAPRSSAWSPPSPGGGKRPGAPGEGCCCGYGWPSTPPSSQWWGTSVLVAALQIQGVFHFSCPTPDKALFYLTCECKKMLIFNKSTNDFQPSDISWILLLLNY